MPDNVNPSPLTAAAAEAAMRKVRYWEKKSVCISNGPYYEWFPAYSLGILESSKLRTHFSVFVDTGGLGLGATAGSDELSFMLDVAKERFPLSTKRASYYYDTYLKCGGVTGEGASEKALGCLGAQGFADAAELFGPAEQGQGFSPTRAVSRMLSAQSSQETLKKQKQQYYLQILLEIICESVDQAQVAYGGMFASKAAVDFYGSDFFKDFSLPYRRHAYVKPPKPRTPRTQNSSPFRTNARKVVRF